MAKIKRIPLGLEPGQQRIELPDRVSVELASLAGTVREGLLAFAVGVGMQVFRTMLEEDVTVVAGPKSRHDPTGRVAYRHGDQESSVVLGGRKVAVSRPRVRGVAGGELALPIWEAFAGEELLGNQVMASLLAGVSTRSYDKALEPVGSLEASATSRSAVSRRFVARTAKALDELMAKDLSDLRICALFADGIEESEHMMVCAIGLDAEGRKHLLGLREGTTENKAVCAGLLSDLVGRGLDFSGGILAVLDGGKGLRAAVREVFGNLGLVQRCRAHKRRNVLDHHRQPPRPSAGTRPDPCHHQPHRVRLLGRPGGDGQGEAVAGRGDGGALDGRRHGGRSQQIPPNQRLQRTANSHRETRWNCRAFLSEEW